MSHGQEFTRLIETLKLAVAALRDEGVPFMLGGSLAAWARGGPEPNNDLDFMVKPADAGAALDALARAGLQPEKPPEEWLFKAWHGDVMVDVIFCPSGVAITDETLARAERLSVMAVGTPVMDLEDVLVTMLCSIDEHSLDYSRLVAIARALREQINWPRLRARTAASPYAKAFFTLVEELGVADPSPVASSAAASPAGARVRVVPASGP